uniref:Uncharacterized protein n=1 Tax=Chromera velia CCMP2878 TaxID=1169474 RepID=A0A0G4I5G7_9ALVE|eukprot:Cvel_11169.t1-p1 / transcript=Cvel_11169.t1 / gene=Cvel_11169 / organism=Chromera_velia_CCMP2878 / gene_product=hypothetical protein / transcript_product=hypothetical protein / location=Cvel_scaffold693:32754-33605(-) / protein_length=284 / sequence_SO=supercontig / SO=protein_coding / is_pseudo=false
MGGRVSRPSEAMCPVALLDVDKTLLFGMDLRGLNVELLEALKRTGILKVYLFTDMTIASPAVCERLELLRVLREDHGFDVLGVLTPCDIAWHSLDIDEAVALGQMCFEEGLYKGRLFGEEFENFIKGQASRLPQLAASISKESIDAKERPGAAFQEASDVFRREREACGGKAEEVKLPQDLFVKSVVAKAIGDHMAEKRGLKHVKGLMLDLFLLHRPAFLTATDPVVAFDDNLEVLETLRARTPLARIQGMTSVPFHVIHVDGSHVKADAFLKEIKRFLKTVRS